MPSVIKQKLAEANEFPSMVVVSITNACSHECVHCQYKEYSKRPGYKKINMDLKLFQKIVDEMSNYPDTILRLVAWGEPCLHPQIAEFVAYAAPKVTTIIITNGYTLDSKLSLELMQGGLDLAEISIDAANIDTYRRVRKSANPDAFNTVVNNTKEMIRLRNLHKLQTKIVVSYVTWPDAASEKEYMDFEHNWQGVADDIVKRRLHSFCGSVDPDLIKLPEDRLPCYGLWGRCIVNPKGKLVICYNQWDENENVLADLNDPDVNIYDTWYGPELKKLRQEQMAHVFSGPCSNCKDYNPFAWEHPFEDVVERQCGCEKRCQKDHEK